MTPLRLLIVVHGFPPTFTAGAELRAQRTARGLVARGVEVRVLCIESVQAPHGEQGHEDRVEDGVLVRRLSLNMNGAPEPFLWSYDNPIVGAATAEITVAWQPSIVHLYSGYLTTASVIHAARNYGVPTVVSLTDYWWLCHRIILVRTSGARCDGPTPEACAACFRQRRRRHRVPSKVWPRATEFVWQLSDALKGSQSEVQRQRDRTDVLMRALDDVTAMIAPSQYLANQYIQAGVRPDKIRVHRQGVELQRVPPVPAEALRVGYLGQMKAHKGVHTLLEAWPKLRGNRARRLVLYGAASGESRYAERVRSMLHQLRDVTWDGHFASEQLWSVLANLDVIVVPSRWPENSPNVILEAQAMGIPVIGTDLGGIPELVTHDRNGLLFAADDAADLARQLQRLLDEPDLLPRLRQHAIPVESVDVELDRLSDLYAEIVDVSSTTVIPTLEPTAGPGHG
ncbi:MAG: glycosyltransferase family 4 protein [Chloroflexi bacterium]|nr:glycosyltransferase family 4 protein [Chloroflexota bacterium]